MANGILLEEKIRASGLKKEFICNTMCISRPTLNRRIHNCEEFTVSEVRKLTAILRLTDREVREIFFDKNVYKNHIEEEDAS